MAAPPRIPEKLTNIATIKIADEIRCRSLFPFNFLTIA
jgi:hypothetical protein